MEDFSDKVKEFIPDGSQGKVKRLLDLMFDEDCRQSEDCEDLLSPCCSGGLKVVFGSFPVEVECLICRTKAVLRDLVTS
jgi:hypothetical protein